MASRCPPDDFKIYYVLTECTDYSDTSSVKESSMAQQHSQGVTGLRNLGNTCYMNAILQCLCSISPLVEYFLSGKYITALQTDSGEAATAFAYLMTDMWLGDSDCVSPEVFRSAIGKIYPTFLKRTQQDAQEFLIYVLNELHEALKKECLGCFFQQDTLTWNNQIHCAFCESKQDAAVRASIAKAPKTVIFHLKRFDCQGRMKRKLRTDIHYPLNNLDLSPYIYPLFRKHPKYSLCGVVNHFGDLDGGHYTAFCKNTVNQTWYSFDDTRVCEIPDSAVQTPAAYLLFYSCQSFSIPTPKCKC
ncbi:ubiquitin carboxyl-terminal hydrolase 50 isoform X4 [Macrotis lagotis]|uniref:ubiquitin carboxyl-terminal hydrolase 50 isoform X4 n=1 Tax=Macrotis lagotis TaxID=92651 RepID=UPI003D6806A2